MLHKTFLYLQAHLQDIVDLGIDHCNKVNITVKQVTQTFWFPSAWKSYVYTTLQSIKCVVPLCLCVCRLSYV